MCDHSLFLESTSGTSPPPQGPPLRKIYVIMSSEPANEATDIPVSEGVQETDLKYLYAKFVEALDMEYSDVSLFQLGGDYDHSKESTGKAVEKDDHLKTRKDGEEVIRAASDLVIF